MADGNGLHCFYLMNWIFSLALSATLINDELCISCHTHFPCSVLLDWFSQDLAMLVSDTRLLHLLPSKPESPPTLSHDDEVWVLSEENPSGSHVQLTFHSQLLAVHRETMGPAVVSRSSKLTLKNARPSLKPWCSFSRIIFRTTLVMLTSEFPLRDISTIGMQNIWATVWQTALFHRRLTRLWTDFSIMAYLWGSLRCYLTDAIAL